MFCRKVDGRSRILDRGASTSWWTQRIVHVRPVEVDGLLRTNPWNHRRIHRFHSRQTGQVSQSTLFFALYTVFIIFRCFSYADPFFSLMKQCRLYFVKCPPAVLTVLGLNRCNCQLKYHVLSYCVDFYTLWGHPFPILFHFLPYSFPLSPPFLPFPNFHTPSFFPFPHHLFFLFLPFPFIFSSFFRFFTVLPFSPVKPVRRSGIAVSSQAFGAASAVCVF